MTRVECFIGCPACKTVLYRVDSIERAGAKPEDHTGIFQHVLVALTDPPADRWKCAGCGGGLARVPEPKA